MKRKAITGISGADNQPRISSFFSQKSLQQKSNATVDLTLEDPQVDEQPPIKKLKVTNDTTLADQWRFDSARKHSVERPTTQGEDTDKKKRHEEFKRVLLAENSHFARRRHHQTQGAQSSEDESDVRDEAFDNLTDKFSYKTNKRQRKTRIGSSAKGKGALEELGPGGQPYTPAELQVSFVGPLYVAFNNAVVQL